MPPRCQDSRLQENLCSMTPVLLVICENPIRLEIPLLLKFRASDGVLLGMFFVATSQNGL
jgi:hypothetical protein